MQRLSAEGRQWLDELELDLLDRHQEWVAEMRYIGQSFELAVAIDADTLPDRTGRRLRERFHQQYRAIYGHEDEHAPLEVLDIRAALP